MIRRSITAMKSTYYCKNCAKTLIPLPKVAAYILKNSNYWMKDGAGRIKCCTCNNEVR